MTLEEHAHAIEEAIWAARKDGFEMTDDDGVIIWRATLWEFRDGESTDAFKTLRMPTESLEK
ncbi:hypothetical protein ABTY96_03300 [Streptomyces sp. NPDC096057]|uniref:hypothetical protein n=1 Tax=Streptomyces sp. NPDC096057 TaxID=3155543 RepID=UPI0033278407